MRQFPSDPEIEKIWKIYPVRIPGQSISRCHNEQTVLVQSMDGGFVTRNCPQCGNKDDTLPRYVFEKLDLWVACPQCKTRMAPEIVDKNYAFTCRGCDLYVRLADLLPRWNDL